MLYSVVLTIHSWLRYPVLIAGVALLLIAFSAVRSRTGVGAQQERAHILFLSLLDTQMLLGLVLYFLLSPITAAAMGDFRAAMGAPELRFFGIEHISSMGIAVTIAHLGRVRSKRVADDARARIVCRAQVAWLVITLLAIPWLKFYVTRPFFRF